MTPGEFKAAYIYRKGTPFDGIRRIDRAPFEGDCDDFAWTMLCLIEGGHSAALRALRNGEAELWLVKSPQNRLIPRHVALWHHHSGREETGAAGWIDSTVKGWRATPAPHEKISRISMPVLLAWLAWGATAGRVMG